MELPWIGEDLLLMLIEIFRILQMNISNDTEAI